MLVEGGLAQVPAHFLSHKADRQDYATNTCIGNVADQGSAVALAVNTESWHAEVMDSARLYKGLTPCLAMIAA